MSDTYFVENNIVYFKPHCDISMSDGSKHTVYFQTYDELDKFLVDLKNELVIA